MASRCRLSSAIVSAATGCLVARSETSSMAQKTPVPRTLDALAANEREMLLDAVTVWLEHNGAWDPAARKLGVHRHTLRHRVSAVERLTGLDLSQFAGRAELWAVLQLARVSPTNE